MKQKTKKILFIFLTLTVIFCLLLVLVANYLYELAIVADKDKTAIFKGFDAQEYEYAFEEDDFFTIVEYNDVFIHSNDNLKLHGYEFKNKTHNNQWVIVVHGYMGEAMEMSSNAHQFYEMGYNVLAIDLRGHGSSEGKYIGMGWDDHYDLMEWINYLINEDSNCEIILYGVSMGATTVMNVSGEEIPSQVKLAIEDCGFTSVWDILKYQMNEIFDLPSFPLLNITNIITQIKCGYSFKQADTRQQLANAKIPILFIHGNLDTFVPFYMLDELYDSANCPKEKLVIKDAWHGVSSKVDPLTYWNKVKSFIHKYTK